MGGRGGSATPPWLAGWPDGVYLDGYVVADFTALGVLNADVPSGPLASAHHSAAGRAAYGAGALFACRTGTAGPDPDESPSAEATATVHLSWHDKAAGASYDEMIGALSGEGRSVWLRQLVLGAGPELLGGEPARRRAVVGRLAGTGRVAGPLSLSAWDVTVFGRRCSPSPTVLE